MCANRFRPRFFLTIVFTVTFTCAWIGSSPPVQAEQSTINLRAAAALVMPVRLELNDVPLKAAVESLAKQAGVSVVWDEEALVELDLPGEETIAYQTSQKLQLQRALSLVLSPLLLTYEDRGDSIYVTSLKKWNQRVVKARYEVPALISERYSNADLIERISKEVAKGSWQSEHPDQLGYIVIEQGVLQVTHRRNVQIDLDVLLHFGQLLQAAK